MRHQRVLIGAALLILSFTDPGLAQDIEPRRWTPLPVGMNVLGVGVIHTDGDISVTRCSNSKMSVSMSDTAVVSYLHAFELAGQSARFDVRLPLQDARWEGLLGGEPASTQRTGLADPRIRLSVNFLGAPALKGKELQAYRASHPVNTVVGAALAVTSPLANTKKVNC